MKKTFKIHNFGCRTNKYESQVYTDQLLELGLKQEESDELVDIHIINSCSVTKKAEKECLLKVKELLREERSEVFFTGCATIFLKQTLDRLHVVANKEKETLVNAIFPEFKQAFQVKNFSQTRAFIKVQDGCDGFCSYCIIPLVRGRSRSRKMEDILSEIRGLVEKGFKEVVITGINVGDFLDGENGLADLIEKVDEIKGLERIRVSSIDPNQIDERLENVIINGSKTAPSMHLSLQSGSNDVLKRMNRKYRVEDFYKVVESLKRKKSDFTFTTDVIVGFPGETDADFEKSLKAVEEIKFAKVHVFPYSRRPDTAAANFLSQISPEIIKKRKDLMLESAQKEAFNLREKYVGKRLMVLIEEKQNSNYIFGHSENFLPVQVINGNFSRNDLIEIEVLKNSNEGLIGKKT
jgi:threonylcarbamoyladenosine tRNA methylthiotransferase MtaB